jgi:hypothetical protein
MLLDSGDQFAGGGMFHCTGNLTGAAGKAPFNPAVYDFGFIYGGQFGSKNMGRKLFSSTGNGIYLSSGRLVS